ncbi:hypothetical protein EHS11_00750 [Leptospira ilyithenensis]|uniref:Uncharacterized protein n=2 Tax=Leptospira ilyithenensis TaxID=2484901 RepID=A0A4R9LUT6_9LEPT|nr:hypothetical protein EHS11_00750 [Leptospira ilyithenensis]
MLSKEEQMLEECKSQRKRAYTYMVPLLNLYNKPTVKEDAPVSYAIVTEITNKRCEAEAKKNQYNLRSN